MTTQAVGHVVDEDESRRAHGWMMTRATRPSPARDVQKGCRCTRATAHKTSFTRPSRHTAVSQYCSLVTTLRTLTPTQTTRAARLTALTRSTQWSRVYITISTGIDRNDARPLHRGDTRAGAGVLTDDDPTVHDALVRAIHTRAIARWRTSWYARTRESARASPLP